MRADRSRRRRRRSRFFVFRRVIEITFLLLLAIILGTIGGTLIGVSKILPAGADVSSFEPNEATKIFSSDGVLLASIFEENREVVPITEVPKDLRDATIAIEDSRFYKHMGVDVIGVGRAIYQNVRKGHMAQGGSTLTQQLARNIYLTREKKISRKLQEMVLAFQIERNYSKEQILELYLNQVFYGSGAHGVQTAARTYFGKNVKDLSLAESALLAGLPQKPTGYSPYNDIKAAEHRRNIVLNRMAELGYITVQQRDKAKAEKIKLVGLKSGGRGKWLAPWFVDYVIDELRDRYDYSEDMIYKGGLRIYTTLNYKMQKIAEKELRNQVEKARYRKVSQGALISIDPHTGHIRAMVGSVNPDFLKDEFNRAVQAKRQPGSAFKAFVYTAAVDNGYDTDYRIPNKPITYKGKPWPKNYSSRQGAGSYTMKEAVKQSINIPAVRMAEELGIDRVITYARMLGIKSELHPNLSLALGADVVSPMEMCSAYGVFAANGVRAEPMCVTKITGSKADGEYDTLAVFRPETRRVLSEQTASTMSELFRNVVVGRGGTGYAAAKVPNAHGKTGTTSDDRDAWFVGYTPELATAVWVGNDDYRLPMRSVWGGNVCAPAWAAFMSEGIKIHKGELEKSKDGSANLDTVSIEENKPKPTEKRPRNEPRSRKVTICADSGQLATEDCPTTYQTELTSGREHLVKCPMHSGGGQDGVDVAPPAGYDATPGEDTQSPDEGGAGSTGGNGQYVDVAICVDTGNIANEYCTQTIVKRYLAAESPRKICRMHKPPAE